MSFHQSFAAAEAEYYSDHIRERQAQHSPCLTCECDNCFQYYAEDERAKYGHDWRFCGCDACSLTYMEYEKEMGE